MRGRKKRVKTLAEQLAEMQPRQVLYETVKKEMIARGRWKKLPRGKPFEIREE